MLQKDIRKKLKEVKVKKELILVEQKIVESRIMMIFESQENINNFSSLPVAKQKKLVGKLIQEFKILGQQDILNEQLLDFMGKIFGQGFSAILQTIVEPMVNSILSGLGMQNSFFSKTLSSFLIRNPSKIIKAFKDCRSMTEVVASALVEAMLMTVQEQQGLQGTGFTVVRNALLGALENTAFAKDLSDKLENFVCQMYESLTGKAEKVYGKLKTDVQPVKPAMS